MAREVTNDGRIAGGEEWQEKVYNREEWKKGARGSAVVEALHYKPEGRGIDS
jgi:hypothetical protein